MSETQTIIVAVTSDQHVGSTLGLCPPGPIPLDDGGSYKPSRQQRWLWQEWGRFWRRVEEKREREGALLYNVFNGDATDGDHHNTPQIVSRNSSTEADMVEAVFAVPQALRPDRTFVVRGTETHVGRSGAGEEKLAKTLGAEPDPSRGTDSWWHLRMQVQGLLLSFTHHGRTGYRPWTFPNASALLAAQIFYEHASRGKRHPDLAVRSHFHRFNDSHDAHPVRVLQLGAWQLATAYVHKVLADAGPADVGGAIVTIRGGEYEVEKVKSAVKTEEATWVSR